MNIIVQGSHLEITRSIQDYLAKRLRGIEKLVSSNAKIQADLGKTSNHHKHGDIFKAEFNIYDNGQYTRVMREGDDLYAAIDLAKDEAYEALSTKKDKKQSLYRKGALKIKQFFKAGNIAAL